ncbi:MAG: methionyl-tRNA formyltransferase [Planctomycetes bacterium]|nr:methionyl-tRNA formyltransferase [Planctomycetota bacterium]
MRIVFAGTPDYAVPSLRAIHALAPWHEVVAVVTQPDRPKGRSGEASPPPVKAAALELGFPDSAIFQPPSFNRSDHLAALRALKPDLFCIIAYGGLLKDEALALPAKYPLNAHASLLPKHRGAAPIQAALLAGDSETGVCIMKMVRALDAGPVMWRERLIVRPTDTAGTLHDALAELSARGFVEAIAIVETGTERFESQDDAQSTYAPKLDKDTGTLDWSREAAYLERFVRAMTPWPGAWTEAHAAEGKPIRLRVARATPTGDPRPAGAKPGCAWVAGIGSKSERWCVACGSGTLELLDVQPAGKQAMPVAAFLRGAGRAMREGARLGACV